MYHSLRATLKSRGDGSSSGPPKDHGSSLGYNSRLLSRTDTDQTLVPDSLSPPLPLHRSRTEVLRRNDPLGLHVVYDPPGERIADIVFVHGLGGSSRLTWSWKKDISLFWPEQWLPLEPGMQQVRILTFGYNASVTAPNTGLFNIAEFANDLLLQMKFGNDQKVNPLELGKVPIIFVVHSMGGLVVKKAYILGTHDPNYRQLVDTVSGIVFLATPHRGTQLAEVLNRCLQVSFQSPKHYVNDLQKSSTRISDINDQFRHHADKLELVSFFETQPTSTMWGLGKTIIVERESAVLGYPGEISSPLDADHHTVCKYPSREDSNYINVRNVIRSLVERMKPQSLKRRQTALLEEDDLPDLDDLFHRLEVAERPDDHLEAVLQACVLDSCDWIFLDEQFNSFVHNDGADAQIFHIMGAPGAGKSVLSSFVARRLEEELGLPVQFWFFRFDDKQKRSLRDCLLSLSFQIARSLPEYGERLVSMAAALGSIKGSDVRSVWQKLFANVLGKLRGRYHPLYLVLDAVDESDNAQGFLGILSTLKHLSFPLRIILTTRPNTVTRHMDRLKKSLPQGRVSEMIMSAPERSLELCVMDELQYTPWPDDLKTTIIETLLKKSQGNFLWLSLVMKGLANCDTIEELEEVLDETPVELVEVYQQIEMSIEKGFKTSNKSSDVRLLKSILAWVTVSEKQLSVDELTEALKPEFSLLNLQHTISRLCGDLVVIDKLGKVRFTHHTVKEYLLKSAGPTLAVDSGAAHRLIFDKCISILGDHRFRMRLKHEGCTGLLRYCCLFWWHHLAHGDVGVLQQQYRHQIATFFDTTACLAWIEAVAKAGQLRVLTSTAKALAGYLGRRRQADMVEGPISQPLRDIELLKLWSVELVRVVAKFGTHLAQYPSCVYSLVPLFSPAESLIRTQFLATGPTAPRVTGISNREWDDSLAKFTLGSSEQPLSIQCLDNYFGILTSEKALNLYHSATFQEVRKFHHDENIEVSVFSQAGDLLMTCGLRTVKVWDVFSGEIISVFSNPLKTRTKAASFSRDGSEIILCGWGSTISRQLIAEPEDWQHVNWKLKDDPFLGGGRGTPVCAAFSPDGSQLAVCYRGTPISVWGTERGNFIGSNNRGRRGWKFGHATRLTWNPVSEHIVGVNGDHSLFKWYPLDNEAELELEIDAWEVACSPDGRLVVIAAPDGSLKILAFDTFSLLYTMSCNTVVTGLTFSPDSRRIYDLRLMFCNVWEPNALTRMAEMEEKGSDAASSDFELSSTVSEVSRASTVISKPVTAVCVDLNGEAFAFGDHGGEVTFVSGSSDSEGDDDLDHVKVKCGFLGVSHLAMSRDGEWLAIATMDRKVTVRGRGAKESSQPWQKVVFKAQATDLITHLLFDTKVEHLLIGCKGSAQVWKLETAASCRPTQCARLELEGARCGWTLHPSSEDHFLAVTATTVSWYKVTDLSLSQRFKMDTSIVGSADLDVAPCPTLSQRLFFSHLANTGDTGASVDSVFVTPCQSQLLLQTSRPSSATGRRDVSFRLLDLKGFSDSGPRSDGVGSPILVARPLPLMILQEIEMPLGFIVDDAAAGSQRRCSLVYIDRDFWVRSWKIGTESREAECSRRHFFLPRDWINVDCISLAQVTVDGRFLCPRSGEVAVVHNALRAEWAG